MSKYAPLQQHLASLDQDTWTATFADIEAVLGFPLPASARKHRAWWANDAGPGQHPHAKAWLGAGWRAREDLATNMVTFTRSRQPDALTRQKVPALAQQVTVPAALLAPHDWECGGRIQCRLTMEWRPLGRVVLDDNGRLRFPAASAVAGIYRFRVREEGREILYVGESDNLARRFSNYRNPTPGQRTSTRINGILVDSLRADAEVSVAVVTAEAWTEVAGTRRQADLRSKALRVLFEHTAITLDGGENVEVLNRAQPQAAKRKSERT
jgi:hypothetical protein